MDTIQNIRFTNRNNLKKFADNAEKIILSKFVEICAVGKHYQYYKNLGYEIEKARIPISVSVYDLPTYSFARVTVMCPLCQETREVFWGEINRANHTYCNPCARAYDLLSVKFNQLLVVKYAGRKDESILWKCLCDCGKHIKTTSDHLVNGDQKSCGGIRVGETSHAWNSEITQAERIKSRSTIEFTRFRRKALKLNPNGCYICKTKTEIEVHHLYSVRHFPEKMYDPTNGVPLCKPHHYDFHRFMGRTQNPCTPDDFFEWAHSLNHNN